MQGGSLNCSFRGFGAVKCDVCGVGGVGGWGGAIAWGSEGQVDVRGGCAAERGEEGSGEKGEEALQKREQNTGHADCHEPPEPAKFISHHVHSVRTS